MIAEDRVLAFAAASLKSVWALELLLTLKRHAERSWRPEEMIRELRSSQVVVGEALQNLQSAGLIVADEALVYRYQPGSSQMAEFVDELEKLYAVKPTTVIRAIVTSPNKQLQILSDAFKITK